MEIHFQKRNREMACAVTGGASGVRRRALAWYRFWRTISVATTRDGREAPGRVGSRQCDIAVWLIRNTVGLTIVRMAVGRGPNAVVLRVNTHCKT